MPVHGQLNRPELLVPRQVGDGEAGGPFVDQGPVVTGLRGRHRVVGMGVKGFPRSVQHAGQQEFRVQAGAFAAWQALLRPGQ